MSIPLDENTRRFLDSQAHATVSTIDADGGPHQAVVWFMRDGDEIVVNSAIGRRWPGNLLRDPRLSVSVEDGGSWVGLAGTARSIRGEAAQADIAELARRFDPAGADARIAVFRTQERVTFRLRPERVHVEIGDE